MHRPTLLFVAEVVKEILLDNIRAHLHVHRVQDFLDFQLFCDDNLQHFYVELFEQLGVVHDELLEKADVVPAGQLEVHDELV